MDWIVASLSGAAEIIETRQCWQKTELVGNSSWLRLVQTWVHVGNKEEVYRSAVTASAPAILQNHECPHGTSADILVWLDHLQQLASCTVAEHYTLDRYTTSLMVFEWSAVFELLYSLKLFPVLHFLVLRSVGLIITKTNMKKLHRPVEQMAG